MRSGLPISERRHPLLLLHEGGRCGRVIDRRGPWETAPVWVMGRACRLRLPLSSPLHGVSAHRLYGCERVNLQHHGVPGVLTVGLRESRAVMAYRMSVLEQPCGLYGAPLAHERRTRMVLSLLSAGESHPPSLGPLVPTPHLSPSESARMT